LFTGAIELYGQGKRLERFEKREERKECRPSLRIWSFDFDPSSAL
jgi:hypothetical protein